MMTKKITSGQESRICDLIRDAVRNLGFSKDEAQEIIKAGGVLQGEVKPILRKLAMVDQRFGPAIVDFEFTVPSAYNHDTQLDIFAERTKKISTTYYFHEALTSKNFAGATNKLLPDKTYRVRIFPVLETVETVDCMNFLQKQGVIFVGAQGLTLLQESKPDKFPVDKWTVSLDEKQALWESDNGDHGVLYVKPDSEGGWGFNLCYFQVYFIKGRHFLCFSEPLEQNG